MGLSTFTSLILKLEHLVVYFANKKCVSLSYHQHVWSTLKSLKECYHSCYCLNALDEMAFGEQKLSKCPCLETLRGESQIAWVSTTQVQACD